LASIYLDPEAKDVTGAHIEAFERGKFGPIWATAGVARAVGSSPSYYTAGTSGHPASSFDTPQPNQTTPVFSTYSLSYDATPSYNTNVYCLEDDEEQADKG
jgi:hypothetical protein